jgi:hypothetical protein
VYPTSDYSIFILKISASTFYSEIDENPKTKGSELERGGGGGYKERAIRMKKGVKSCDKGRQTERKREGKEKKESSYRKLITVRYQPVDLVLSAFWFR